MSRSVSFVLMVFLVPGTATADVYFGNLPEGFMGSVRMPLNCLTIPLDPICDAFLTAQFPLPRSAWVGDPYEVGPGAQLPTVSCIYRLGLQPRPCEVRIVGHLEWNGPRNLAEQQSNPVPEFPEWADPKP